MKSEINKKVLSMKPDPDFIKKPTFKFDESFFRKYFVKGKLRVEIAKFDGRQSDRTFTD